MKHHARNYHGREPLAFPVAGRVIVADLKRQEARAPKKIAPEQRLFIALLCLLILSLLACYQARRDYLDSISPHPTPSTPTPALSDPRTVFPRVDFHTPEADEFRGHKAVIEL